MHGAMSANQPETGVHCLSYFHAHVSLIYVYMWLQQTNYCLLACSAGVDKWSATPSKRCKSVYQCTKGILSCKAHFIFVSVSIAVQFLEMLWTQVKNMRENEWKVSACITRKWRWMVLLSNVWLLSNLSCSHNRLLCYIMSCHPTFSYFLLGAHSFETIHTVWLWNWKCIFSKLNTLSSRKLPGGMRGEASTNIGMFITLPWKIILSHIMFSRLLH